MTRPLFTHSDKWKMENKTIYFMSIIHQAVDTHGSFSQWNIPMLWYYLWQLTAKNAAGEYIRFVRVLPPINIWTGRGVTEPRVSRHSVWAAAS